MDTLLSARRKHSISKVEEKGYGKGKLTAVHAILLDVKDLAHRYPTAMESLLQC
jgi:hypothetical protein